MRAPGDCRMDGFPGAVDGPSARIAQDDARIRAAAGRSPAARIIKTVPDVGDCTALVLDPGIDDVGRFVRAAKLCACPGLVPSVGPSGDTARYGPITRRGSPIMRWVLTGCVHPRVRYAPRPGVPVSYKRPAKKRGPARATVAAAPVMLKVVYRMLGEDRAFVQNYGQEVSCGEHTGGEEPAGIPGPAFVYTAYPDEGMKNDRERRKRRLEWIDVRLHSQPLRREPPPACAVGAGQCPRCNR